MPEALELPSLTAAAARAASADDAPAAAALLRQVLELQASTLGPDHPDLATTLNNLALMLERLGQTDEAGRCYRRAYAIAAAALGPDDPVVQVSRENLDTFRATYGQAESGDGSLLLEPAVWGELDDFPAAAGEPVPPSRTGLPEPERQQPPAILQEDARQAEDEEDDDDESTFELAPPPVSVPTAHAAGGLGTRSTRPSRPPVLGIVAVAVVLAGLAALWWSRSAPQPPVVATDPGPQASVTAQPEAARPAASTTPSSGAAAGPAAGDRAAPPPGATKPAARTGASGPLGVADARLCAALSRSRNPWVCKPPVSPVQTGRLYYYTRLRATRDVVVRHRWTRDGRVVRDARLQIRANPTDGFRTFSRQPSGPGAGTWVVSLLGPDGAVLDEQRFDVR